MSELNDDVTTTPEITSEITHVEQNPTLATKTAELIEVPTNAPEPEAMEENNTPEMTSEITHVEQNATLSNDSEDFVEVTANKPEPQAVEERNTPEAEKVEAAIIETSNIINYAVDQIEISDDEHELVVEELPDFNHLGKEELLATALAAAQDKEVNEAIQILKVIRPQLDVALNDEEAQALHKFIEEGGEKDNFEWRLGDKIREQFNKTFKELKDKKLALKQAQEAEKVKNLAAKNAILDQIKQLNESEGTMESLKKPKELQNEWKRIKHVPAENVESIYESYRVQNEIFYDKFRINIELIQLDREKNLDQKIELCKKVSELSAETSLKKALISVKKFQEDWKNIGPVPKEANEDIWTRFKAEVDKVYTFIKAESEKMEGVRQENLTAKQLILDKAKELESFTTNRIKDWLEKTEYANQLMEEWKKIGHVPLAVREQIWNDFRTARNNFFNNKNNYFKTLNLERNQNLKLKTEMCEKAEEISANPIDWAKQTEELKGLQDKWKSIGQVGDKMNDVIWKRFRSACDAFFAKKAERYATVIDEQKQNLEKKNGLIAKLEELAAQEDVPNVFAELKTIQDEWNGIGYVPNANKNDIFKKYNDLLDKLYGKYRQLNKDMRSEKERQQFNDLATAPNGAHRLQREEKILLERIKGMKGDIDTWENNLGFFKHGNSKNVMAEQIQDKIAIANKHVKELEEKLKTLRSIKSKNESEA